MALFSSVTQLEVEGPILGAFAGSTFVASWQEDGQDLLAKWTSPHASPELVTPVDPRVTRLAATPDGGRVAIAGVVEAEGRELVELLVATLAPPSGVRLVRPSAALTFEAEVAPRLLWSADGRHLALGGLHGTSAEHVVTMVFDLGRTPPKTSVVFGRPVVWQEDRLCVALGDACTAWSAGADAEVAWDGAEREVAPDGTASVVRGRDGAVTIEARGEGARPLVGAPAELAWVGPHHLATEDGRALDVLTRKSVDLLPPQPKRGRASLVALGPEGREGVFERDGAFLWARVER